MFLLISVKCMGGDSCACTTAQREQQATSSVLNRCKFCIHLKNNDGSGHCLGGLCTLAEDREHYSHSGSETNWTKNPGWDESHERCPLSPLYRQCLSLTSSASLPSVNYPVPLPAHWTKTVYSRPASTLFNDSMVPWRAFKIHRTCLLHKRFLTVGKGSLKCLNVLHTK